MRALWLLGHGRIGKKGPRVSLTGAGVVSPESNDDEAVAREQHHVTPRRVVELWFEGRIRVVPPLGLLEDRKVVAVEMNLV